MSEPKLKPCPFCNGQKLKIESKSKNIGHNGLDVPIYLVTYSVRCNICRARGGTASGKVLIQVYGDMGLPSWATTKEALIKQAADKWNRRSTDE